MPVEFDDDDGDASTTGKGLRGQLEAQLAANKLLATELHSLKAKDVIGSYDQVTIEDLEGVAVEQLEERASEIQAERQALREAVARDLLGKQGLHDADLDKAVTDLLAGDADPSDAIRRARRTSEVGGSPVPTRNPENLHGRDAIAAGVKG